MGQKKKKLAKGRLDKFYYLAKEQGYRSRAAFKLIQLNKKYNFLGNAKACLDLCAAPGGWMQVASKYMPVQSLIVGVDLDPIRQVRNCISIADDITTQHCRAEIRKALKTWKVDVCLHDGAPNMGTSWVQDAYQQAELTLHALKLATEFLTTGGWFVTKVFRGPDYNSLIYIFNKLFKKVESTKPQASRNVSAEIFVVCQGFINPKKIDPKLLDPKYVFKEIQEGPKKVDILSDKKAKRNRQGYEDGVNVLFKKAFVSDFINSTEHLRVLSANNQLEWDEQSKIYLEHPETTTEIKECFKDLKVLGKFDFSKIIKWRKEMIQYKEKLENPNAGDELKPEVEDDTPKTLEEMDRELDEQIKQLMENVEKKKRKEKKKANEKKRDLQKRIELQMHIPGDSIQESADVDLFTVRGKNQILNLDAEATILTDSEDDENYEEYSDDEEANFDKDEFMEQQIDKQYNDYLVRIKNRRAKEVEKVSKNKVANDEDMEDDNQDDQQMEDDDDEGDNEIYKSGKRKAASIEATTNLWFDQDLFGSVQNDEENDDDEDNQEDQKVIQPKKKLKLQNQSTTTTTTTTTSSKKNNKKEKSNGKYQTPPTSMDLDNEEDEKDENNYDNILNGNNFEEVPLEKDIEMESDDSEDEDDKIKTLALGQFLLRKKTREEMYDNTFNRYSFADQELPLWFTDDENRHNKPQTPLTKEMVNEIRQRIKEIDSRPIKKIAEAKARKKYRATKKMEKIRDKANSVVDNPEMSNREKARAIEKMYKGQDKTKTKNKKIVVIAKKSKTAGGGSGKYKMVDKRQKKELRSQKAKDKRAGIKTPKPKPRK
ncbi:rRNA methyltransferase [Tieghemostelium lacteum]|uniref:Putative rRNA methyltransferase n=1 Tax=Tieghemostelium lacteum TaxID=361077 RepID=A0A152AA68_TIELA|nr:rRNA methyltransferase [Tieghemostelium lacteum]|eukprot:KYR03119.1 rRNA methyltransferase [Tieghemostelium lacteum]